MTICAVRSPFHLLFFFDFSLPNFSGSQFPAPCSLLPAPCYLFLVPSGAVSPKIEDYTWIPIVSGAL